MKIVIIDDEKMIQVVTGKILSKHGHEVFAALSGEAGLELLKSHVGRVDLVILDLGLKGMSGLETFQKIREFDSEMPVLFSSGFQVDYGVMGLADDANVDVLEKPYETGTLLVKIEQMVPV